MQTPWGESITNQQLEEGVFWVTTNEAGGILVESQHAQVLLSAKACSIGRPWCDFLAFEQDHAMLVVFYEQPHLYPWVEEELSAKLAEDCLRLDFPNYFRTHEKMELCLMK
ncbi:DUF7007 domain-containing protein [Ktedonospora formicarum]|uniref:DUF7007 domain-containing protein n=1 Tax=Ktedonospora formicarum TaxID=2778364 RepID=A0A8J3HU16_9CHLR|nr:hypothetical protein [Ktedonospora formicarum]GHO41971.1 hypothetical protein KSX_01340 [Ktedonospora formicarum]